MRCRSLEFGNGCNDELISVGAEASMLLVVVLVMLLRLPEGWRRRDDLSAAASTSPHTFFYPSIDLLLHLLLFIRIVAKDHRTILTPDIGALPILGGGIV